MRAVLFAKATAVNNGGFLDTMRASQEPSGAPLRKAHLTTATAPQIKSRIHDSGQIEGGFTQAEAQDLASLLRAGALPVHVTVLEEQILRPKT